MAERDPLAPSGYQTAGVIMPRTDLPLKPRDYILMGFVFEGMSMKAMAERLELSVETIRSYVQRPDFKREVERMKDAIYCRIMDGEFGVMSMAKAEAPLAMGRIIEMSKSAKNEKVRFDANVKIMELAGHRPAAPQVTESPERLIDEMTAPEIDHFIQTGEFPERMQLQLARVASAVIKERDPRYQPLVIEDAPEPDNG